MSTVPRFAATRGLGRTGFRATALGLGDVADRTLGLATCADLLRRGFDAGVNVVDTAPAYENGFSEEVVGEAIRGRRDGLFVIDKVDELDDPVAPQVDASVARLGTEPDAFVLHSVSKPDAFRQLCHTGRFDELLDQRAKGRCRFVGISSHHPDALRDALEDGRCDLLMFPVGPFVDARYVEEILPRARARGVATVTFKTFGAGMLVAETSGYGRPLEPGVVPGPPLSVEECVHYTLTLGPDCALAGLSSVEEQSQAFAAWERFAPMGEAALADVRTRAVRAIAGKGRVGWEPST